MNIEVRLYATLRRYLPETPNGITTIEVTEGITVLEVINQLGIDPAEVHLSMLNGMGCELAQTVNHGDRLGLFPPIGGG